MVGLARRPRKRLKIVVDNITLYVVISLCSLKWEGLPMLRKKMGRPRKLASERHAADLSIPVQRELKTRATKAARLRGITVAAFVRVALEKLLEEVEC